SMMDVFVVKNTQVVVIAAWFEGSVFKRLYHSAAGLFDMQAIVKAAFAKKGLHFPEVMRNLLLFQINHPKIFNARRINQTGFFIQKKHLCKSGGVFPFVGIGRNLAGFLFNTFSQSIKQGGFTYTGMA